MQAIALDTESVRSIKENIDLIKDKNFSCHLCKDNKFDTGFPP